MKQEDVRLTADACVNALTLEIHKARALYRLLDTTDTDEDIIASESIAKDTLGDIAEQLKSIQDEMNLKAIAAGETPKISKKQKEKTLEEHFRDFACTADRFLCRVAFLCRAGKKNNDSEPALEAIEDSLHTAWEDLEKVVSNAGVEMEPIKPNNQ